MQIEQALQKTPGFGSKEFIERAVKGGWTPAGVNCVGKAPSWIKQAALTRSKFVERYLLSPNAWHAVAKTENWYGTKCYPCAGVTNYTSLFEFANGTPGDPCWLHAWIEFIHALAEEESSKGNYIPNHPTPL